jgi:hypothetical protein
LAATRTTGAFGVTFFVVGGVVLVVVVVVGAVVGSVVDVANVLVWLAVSAATAICGAADESVVPDEHAARAATAITADSPITIFLMPTGTPSANRRRSATALDCQFGFQ